MQHLNIDIDHYEVDGTKILGSVALILNRDDRVAIVWANGIGKSTLMKIISWQITEYIGSIANVGSLTLGYLEQIHFLDESLSVREDLANAFTEVRALEARLQKIEQEMEATGEYTEYTELLERFQQMDGYTYMNRVERIARWIGIFHLLDHTLAWVSWGERTKIALAKTLLSAPDFLLLDEPTNFIDLQSVEWLEIYLRENWKWWYCIISHDREFLDKTCEEVIELRGPHGIEIYPGDYTYYVHEKKKRHEKSIKLFEEQSLHIANEKILIDRFRAGSRAWFAKSRERALEKIQILERPEGDTSPGFQFLSAPPPSEKIFHFENAFIGRRDPLFFIRDLALHRGDRVGIIGENGVWKSTLLRTILHTIPLLDGAFSLGKWCEIVYYSQMHEELYTEATLFENFSLHGLIFTREHVAHILGHYGFAFSDLDTRVADLSGWERSKLLFAILWQKESNILILDEPTNHLDYASREALERALSLYEGTILFISHDRYFVNKLATILWIIEDGELIVSYGWYDDYQYKKEHGITLDMSLFDASGELDLVLEEELGPAEAKRIREKFARKRKG